MALLNVEFEWCRAAKGFRLVVPEPPVGPQNLLSRATRSPYLEPVNDQGERYSIDSTHHHQHYIEFMDLRTNDGVLRFFNRYGPLTLSGFEIGEEVESVLDWAARFRSLHEVAKWNPKQRAAFRAGTMKFGRLDVLLTIDNSGKTQLQIRPSDLLSLMLLQLAQAVTGERAIRECEHCGKWFQAGPKTGRRLDSKFCSKEHQRLFNNLRRSRPAPI
jgi:hypothetical protein